jgi:pyridoxamine 5'-phosphate oxidase
MTSLAALRRDFLMGELNFDDVDPDPIREFRSWLDHAIASGVSEPNTMTLSTVNAKGRPASRIMLIKGVDERGFVFFTNYQSRKGRELAANPYASLLFYWGELERQVRIEGPIVRTSAAESDAYFNSRPLGSRISALASAQSEVIESGTAMELCVKEIALRHPDQPPRPPHWGGFRLTPDVIEFWQGRASRLHDRLLYTRANCDQSQWRIVRLAP